MWHTGTSGIQLPRTLWLAWCAAADLVPQQHVRSSKHGHVLFSQVPARLPSAVLNKKQSLQQRAAWWRVEFMACGPERRTAMGSCGDCRPFDVLVGGL